MKDQRFSKAENVSLSAGLDPTGETRFRTVMPAELIFRDNLGSYIGITLVRRVPVAQTFGAGFGCAVDPLQE